MLISPYRFQQPTSKAFSFQMSKAGLKAYSIFMNFVTTNERDELDASQVLSPECYNTWLESRKTLPKHPEEAFRKTLTSHCRGDQGMKPFPEDVETEILKVIRIKRIWPCFEGRGIRIGLRGYQVQGYWERRRAKKPVESSSTRRRSSIEGRSVKRIKIEPAPIQIYEPESWKAFIDEGPQTPLHFPIIDIPDDFPFKEMD